MRVMLFFLCIVGLFGGEKHGLCSVEKSHANAAEQGPVKPSKFIFTNLQEQIDAAAPGAILTLAPGRYRGSVIITKPLTLDGNHQVILDGLGSGSVVIVRANHVSITRLTLVASGNSHDKIDAAIGLEKASHGLFDQLTIRDTLFGISLRRSHDNVISNNEIQSKEVDLGIRGDALRVWASHRNTFRKNRVFNSRDVVIWYSDHNRVVDNEGWDNRYGLHFMYSGYNYVAGNHYRGNAVGIFLMYGKDTVIENNTIQQSIGSSGLGIGMKEVDNITLRKNKIIYCASGIYLDQSPHDPYLFNFIKGNVIAHNVQGIALHGTLRHNIFKGNSIRDNLDDIVVHSNGTAKENVWEGNFWGSYRGFDRNRDAIGDTPFQSYAYADQQLTNDPWIRFFYASPILTAINFLTRLAPFSQPRHLLSDNTPIFSAQAPRLLSKENLYFDAPTVEELEALEDEEEDEYAL